MFTFLSPKAMAFSLGSSVVALKNADAQALSHSIK